MPRPITDLDLIDLALGRLDPLARERVEGLVRRDRALERRYRAIADHLSLWDTISTAPPPPPFSRVRPRLSAPASRPKIGWLASVPRPPKAALEPVVASLLVAIAVGAALLFVRGHAPDRPGPGTASASVGRAGPGIRVERAGDTLREGTELRIRDALEAEVPAEARLGDRVQVVLDRGASLSIRGAECAALHRGRVYFHVGTGPFAVETPLGVITVLGTRFEVALAEAGLEIRVEEGRVTFDGVQIDAGQAWQEGRLVPLVAQVGAWFRRPRLALRVPATVRARAPVTIELEFSNPGMLPVALAGPAAVRTSFWLEVTLPGGEVLDLPLDRGAAGTSPLAPARDHLLGPQERLRLPLRVPRTFEDPGTYRCRALYRPEHPPSLLSETATFEVR